MPTARSASTPSASSPSIPSQRYSLSSYALAIAAFPAPPDRHGYVWEAPAGPGAIIRYTATVPTAHWREIGERIAGDAPPVRIVELNLRRVGDTAWPAADPVPMR